jgi:hypothetical protein
VPSKIAAADRDAAEAKEAGLEPPVGEAQAVFTRRTLEGGEGVVTLAERLCSSCLEIVEYDDSYGATLASAAIQLRSHARTYGRELQYEDLASDWRRLASIYSILFGGCLLLGARLRAAHEANYQATWWGQDGIIKDAERFLEERYRDKEDAATLVELIKSTITISVNLNSASVLRSLWRDDVATSDLDKGSKPAAE